MLSYHIISKSGWNFFVRLNIYVQVENMASFFVPIIVCCKHEYNPRNHRTSLLHGYSLVLLHYNQYLVCISTPTFCWIFVGMLNNQGFQINSFKQL
jgi:hypothetical protein